MSKLTFTDWLRGVREESTLKTRDPRVRAAAPSTAGNEAVGGEGGFAVPGEFASAIIALVREQSLAGLCATINAGSNNISLPVDEQAPWAASNGFVWESELAAIAQSKPTFQSRNSRLSKITGLIPVSDELMEDAPGLDSYMRVNVPAKIAAKLNTAIVRGTGAGQPAGILNSNCLISVTRGGSVAASAASAWARLPGESQQRAVWLVNPSVAVPTTPGLPLLLHGRPVMGIEACSAPAAVGDIILADLSQYQVITRTLNIAQSLHVFFEADAMAYRFVLRVQGNAMWSAPAAPQHGSDTRSPFVTVAA